MQSDSPSPGQHVPPGEDRLSEVRWPRGDERTRDGLCGLLVGGRRTANRPGA